MRVHLLSAAEAADVAPFWVALEERVGGGRPAISWTWTDTWLRHYGDTVTPSFALFERGGEPIGAALLVLSRRHRLGVRRLHLGTAGEPVGEGVFVEYNDVLCAPEDRRVVIRALLETIRAEPGWDELHVPGLRPEAAAVLAEELPHEASPQQSWTIRLDPDRTVYDGLKGSVRRLVRQARESLEPAAPEQVVSVLAAREAMDEMALLHQERWNAVGRPGVFASRRLAGFLTDLTEAWLDSGRVLLYRLPDSGGKALGCVVGFVEDDRFLYYQAGFRRFPDNRKRAGLLSHVEFAELCRRRGMREYELLAGDARYKRQLSGGEYNTLYWSSYRRPSIRNSGIDLARRTVAAARRVNRSP